jgi:hypothetical protein
MSPVSAQAQWSLRKVFGRRRVERHLQRLPGEPNPVHLVHTGGEPADEAIWHRLRSRRATCPFTRPGVAAHRIGLRCSRPRDSNER